MSVPREQFYAMQAHATKMFIKAQYSLALSSVSCKSHIVNRSNDNDNNKFVYYDYARWVLSLQKCAERLAVNIPFPIKTPDSRFKFHFLQIVFRNSHHFYLSGMNHSYHEHGIIIHIINASLSCCQFKSFETRIRTAMPHYPHSIVTERT